MLNTVGGCTLNQNERRDSEYLALLLATKGFVRRQLQPSNGNDLAYLKPLQRRTLRLNSEHYPGPVGTDFGRCHFVGSTWQSYRFHYRNLQQQGAGVASLQLLRRRPCSGRGFQTYNGAVQRCSDMMCLAASGTTQSAAHTARDHRSCGSTKKCLTSAKVEIVCGRRLQDECGTDQRH